MAHWALQLLHTFLDVVSQHFVAAFALNIFMEVWCATNFLRNVQSASAVLMPQASSALQVFTELVHIPQGSSLAHRFEDVCAGAVASMDFADHIDLVAGPAYSQIVHVSAATHASLMSVDTGFLLVRNECGAPVTVVVDHNIDIVLSLPLSLLRLGTQVWTLHSCRFSLRIECGTPFQQQPWIPDSDLHKR